MIDINNLLKGDRRTLARAITLLESTKDSDRVLAQDLLEKVLPHTGKSFRLGITGVPGVGKSSFIEAFGQYLLSRGHKVAVLAVDPSSPVTGGSIMGDKTRMEKLATMEGAFIRPSPSSGSLGGVAKKTREAILLCEAAGYDYILVETVGVGQSEYDVASMVDFFMLLMLPNAGDELQGIKKGILELANAIVINKADGDTQAMATRSLAQYQSALELFAQNSPWKTRVSTCSALENKNIDKIYEMLQEFQKNMGKENIESLRKIQNKEWFLKLIDELIHSRLAANSKFENAKNNLKSEVLNGRKATLKAAAEYVDLFLK